MKLNTKKYKLSIFTEDSCDDCLETKKILKEKNIPFIDRCISVATEEQKKQNGNTRWDYIDAEREHNLSWYTPVLVIEDDNGEETYLPTVNDKSQAPLGQAMDGPEDTLNVLKPYII